MVTIIRKKDVQRATKEQLKFLAKFGTSNGKKKAKSELKRRSKK